MYDKNNNVRPYRPRLFFDHTPSSLALGGDVAYGGPADSLDSVVPAAASPQSYVDAIRTGLDVSSLEQGPY